MIRENKIIKGIVINNVEHKLSQYADDAEIVLSGERKSFESCIETLSQFANVSGLKINLTKTNAIWLVSKKNWYLLYATFKIRLESPQIQNFKDMVY